MGPVHPLIANAIQTDSLAAGRIEELSSNAGLAITNAPNACVVIMPTTWRLNGPKMSHAAQAAPADATIEDLADPQYRTDNNLIALFESTEHSIISADAILSYTDGSNKPAVSHLIRLENGLALTYGQIIALAGDFYGDPKQPISDLPTQQERMNKVMSNFITLSVDPLAAEQVPVILNIMNKEFKAVQQAISSGLQPSAAYEMLGDTLSFEWNKATGGGGICSDPNLYPCWFPRGRYLMLAGTNWDHFGANALSCYVAGHALAMAMANNATTNAELDQAYAVNAFADHFLTDLFSAGHIRTPRKAMNNDVSNVTPSAVAAFLSRIMHDEDSQYGLWVTNQRGDQWVAYGDKRYRDTADYANAKIVQLAVQQSINDVYHAAGPAINTDSGTALPSVLSTTYIPAPVGDQNDNRNFAPLFYYDPDYWGQGNGQVIRRTDITSAGKLTHSFIPAVEAAHPTTWPSGFTYIGTWKQFGLQTDGPPLGPTGPDSGVLPPATGHQVPLTGAPPHSWPTAATGPDVPRQPWKIIGATGS